MNERFALMEECVRQGMSGNAAAVPALCGQLAHADWRVRYAASVALGDLRDPLAISALLAVLAEEDLAPLFAQPEDYSGGGPAGTNLTMQACLPEGLDAATREAWRRRGRIKQAVCLALGEIGDDRPAVLEALHRYATDPEQDYAVRASACHALWLLSSPASIPALEQAINDHEDCTRMEAIRALEKCKINCTK